MRTRTVINLVSLAAIVGAITVRDLAALYVAIGWSWLAYDQHKIEVKLNKLLDHVGITVWDSDIAKE